MLGILVVIFLVLLFIGVPIGYAMAVSATTVILLMSLVNSFKVFLVSSAAIKSTLSRISRARSVISFKFPIGVATK